MNSRVKITFYDDSCLTRIKTVYKRTKQSKLIDVPRGAAGVNYCFYKGCTNCENLDERSDIDDETDTDDETDSDEENSSKQMLADVKLSYLDSNHKKSLFYDALYNLTDSTYLKRDKCIFLGIPENAVLIDLTSPPSHRATIE